MKDEIESGIRNALERGESLEQAVKSFVAAGYNPVEVREAAVAVSSGAMSIVSQKKELQPAAKPSIIQSSQPNTSSQPQVSAPKQQSQVIGDIQPKPTRARRKIIITIVIILAVILLAILGVWIFGDNILAFFK